MDDIIDLSLLSTPENIKEPSKIPQRSCKIVRNTKTTTKTTVEVCYSPQPGPSAPHTPKNEAPRPEIARVSRSRPSPAVFSPSNASQRFAPKRLRCPVRVCQLTFASPDAIRAHLTAKHQNSFIHLTNTHHTAISINFNAITRIVKFFEQYFVIRCESSAILKRCHVHVGIIGDAKLAKKYKFRLGEANWCGVCVYPLEKFVGKGMEQAVDCSTKIVVHLSKD